MVVRKGGYNAAMAQLVERVLGKDEVPSSNLGSSSKRSPFSSENGDLCYFFARNDVGQNVG